MPDPGPFPLAPDPQFNTAEYVVKPDAQTCTSCKGLINGPYYRVDGALKCATCAEIARREVPTDSHARFVRGLLFGIGGALLGLIMYATFGIVTGLVVGYLSLAVGYIVGKAIHMGSRGAGGRRYQIAAVLLTYAAVSLSAIPMAISEARKHGPSSNAQPSSPGTTSQPVASSGPSDDVSSSSDRPQARSFAAAVGYLTVLGLASPFLDLQDPFHGIIGLIILSVGIRIAWRLTAGSETQILGPFDNRAPASAVKA
jgi:predicted lipid-binding transport protein (Tim44 family)